MPYLNWVEPENATGEAAEFYEEAGMSPIMRCYSLRPDFGKAFNRATTMLHFSHGFLTRRDHEAIATYVSALNHCPFWVDAHGGFLRMQGEDDKVARAIFNGDLDAATKAGLAPERRAMLEFVHKITFDAYKITQGDVDVLRHYGFSDEQIAEVIYIAAMFAMYNRVADAFGINGRGMIDMPVEKIRSMTKNP